MAGALLNRIYPTSSLTIGFLRMAFSSPFLLLAAWAWKRGASFPHRRDWLWLAGMGVAMAGYQVFYFAGIPLAGVAVVVIVALSSAPVMVAAVSPLLFHERLTVRLMVSLTMAIAGTVWLAFSGIQPGTGTFHPLGALLALGAGASYASFTLLAKVTGARSTVDAPTAVALSFTFSAVLLAPLSLSSGGLTLPLPAQAWLLAAYMGVFPTAIAYVLFFSSLRRIPATVATIVALLEPAVATLLAWLVLGEQLSPGAIAAMALLATAVVTLQFNPGARPSGVSRPAAAG